MVHLSSTRVHFKTFTVMQMHIGRTVPVLRSDSLKPRFSLSLSLSLYLFDRTRTRAIKSRIIIFHSPQYCNRPLILKVEHPRPHSDVRPLIFSSFDGEPPGTRPIHNQKRNPAKTSTMKQHVPIIKYTHAKLIGQS